MSGDGDHEDNDFVKTGLSRTKIILGSFKTCINSQCIQSSDFTFLYKKMGSL